MNMSKTIQLRGRVVAGGSEPLVCAPLVARDLESLRAEAAAVLSKRPDLLEWRVDYFEALEDLACITQAARELRRLAAEVPIIYTRRSIREGGQAIRASEDVVSRGIEAVCAEATVDFVDCELSSEPEHFRRAQQAARSCGALLIGSFHDFQRTPTPAELAERFAKAQQLGADVAKVAVMPNHLDDVLTLLQATLDASRRVSMPLITMSMGPYGSLTRLFGWMFGSTVSFAVGASASAPGQIPIEELRTVLGVLQRSLGPR
ncbi:MAG: type I 3-dehydroquinate dehydratase [Betaproteobacteria bacterium]|nr:type I 3-dehydroquinate dehydratase [Betaproteobacteria bacterium]